MTRTSITGKQFDEEELIQNMVDAGCEKDMVASVLICLKQGQKEKGKRAFTAAGTEENAA